MSDPFINALNDARSTLRSQRDQIKDFGEYWKVLVNDQDEFKRTTSKMFLRLLEVLDGAYSKFEEFYILTAGLKSQIDYLDEMVCELPEYKNNLSLQQHMAQVREKYEKAFAKQQESFTKGQTSV